MSLENWIKDITEHIDHNIVTDIPEEEITTLDVDPCEISDQFCEYVSNVKDEYEKRIKRKIKRLEEIQKETITDIKLSFSLYDISQLRYDATKMGFKSVEEYCKFILKNAKVEITCHSP